ncbi:MAG: SDR family oxidoreductase [Dolichospermum sp.]
MRCLRRRRGHDDLCWRGGSRRSPCRSSGSSRHCVHIRSSRIINFSSVAVPMHIQGEAIYASSKAAIEEFSQIFAREVAKFGITVNVIGPSPIMTDLIAKVSPEKIQNLVNKMPLSRLGQFQDVENVIDFFASEASQYITGQVIYLGGVS